MLKIQNTYHLSRHYFDVKKTVGCGQAFRWEVIENAVIGVVKRSVLVIKELDEATYACEVYGASMSLSEVQHYFDLERNYEAVLSRLALKDDYLNRAITLHSGIRMMKQDPYEILISFILSSNNNIPKIKMTIEDLACRYGDLIGTFKLGTFEKQYYTFPDAQKLSAFDEQTLVAKAIGYRNKAVISACKRIVDEGLNLDKPFELSFEAAVDWLKQFYGVGEKVAQCVALFGYYKLEAFPVDTWIKKMLLEVYHVDKGHEAFIKTYFSQDAGIAQQYLFEAYRLDAQAKTHLKTDLKTNKSQGV